MKLFNKIRFKMIEGKRLKNYLLYALGEIVLVVIGILIALAINNWNQNKKIDQENINLKAQVIVQLKNDINNIKLYQKELDTMQQAFRKILGRSYDTTMINTGSVVATVLFELNTITLDNRMINLIDNSNLNDSKTSERLTNLSSLYKSYIEDIEEVENIIISNMNTNLNEIGKTQDWYTELITDFKCNEECVNFLLNDKQHKARMATSRFLIIDGYGGIVEELHSVLEENLDALEKE